MMGANGGDGAVPAWVLRLESAVHDVVTEATTPSDIATQLPVALSSLSPVIAAWLVRPGPRQNSIRVLAAGDPIGPPRTINTSGIEDLPIARALESGAVTVDDPDTLVMTEQLAADGATTGVTIPFSTGPLPTGHGWVMDGPSDSDTVLQFFTTAELNSPAVDRFTRLGACLSRGWTNLVLDGELQRERDRLEALRSAVSHDFGNPLNLTSGRIELATDECESPHLEAATKGLEQIEALIESNLAYVRAGSPVHDPRRVHIETVAAECWATISEESTGTLELEVDEEVLWGDPERIRQVFHELFQNAVTYGDDPKVTVEALTGRPGFTVEDDGPGIPPDERELVFDRGYTTDPDREGRGLALVAEIAMAHGWEPRIADSETGTRIEIITAQ